MKEFKEIKKIESEWTEYIDSNNDSQKTKEFNFKKIKAKEILKLGYDKNGCTIHHFKGKKVPNKLPIEIRSLKSFFSNNPNKIIEGIETWDTKLILDMSYVFENCKKFNGNISRWRAFNATTMEGMFKGAKKFNNDISDLYTFRVHNMKYMFKDSIEFNQDISNWNIVNLKFFRSMFENAHSFNKDLSKWTFCQEIVFSTDYDKNAISWADFNKPKFNKKNT
ncbi:hypothetical protein ESOMN_v1c02480 [Williamsoniiplasma somnilux]|uniref:BspA family leucine-rich repeat surface protein n=1 Tax=Williamsoniiplasma somnilux TaxID=215578 RepID=A0A2K8NXS1_9MOLU|nr:BspA family leucine-rich repeat surface protein [Williamsoniiplasma somnilux]ATZ18632.1 hypothetical protein ESOMN_v1c02480 [Williamsoniiplasma somnilux]